MQRRLIGVCAQAPSVSSWNLNYPKRSLLAAVPLLALAQAGRFQLEQSKDDFGVRSHGIIETLVSGGTKFYPLPQSSYGQYSRLRPDEARINSITAAKYERQEVIGPHQTEGDKIWFGNNYYDGEGDTGVGAFGYFDTAARQYTLFSPPEVARYEVSAMLVEPRAVWLGLDRFIEDISTEPGGLVRWDRGTHATHFYPLEFTIARIQRQGDALRLETRYGHALFHDGIVRRFLSNGIPVATFPPPPTHY
jgi:hypothetical protein